MANPLPYDITYEELLAIKLQDTDDRFNKRPGELLYTVYAQNSIEIIKMLASLDDYRDLLFADTAPRDELIRIAAERGLSPTPATTARLRATFNIDVPIGSRFNHEDVNYVVAERISLGNFYVDTEEPGANGNSYLGNLVPIDDITGLTSAVLVELLIPGEDEEDTEAFRERYRLSFFNVAYGGNRADYKNKVSLLPGVGGVRVFRNQYGFNSVGLTICDSQFKSPSAALVTAVQIAVDPGGDGEGDGIAPINHRVTVSGTTDTTINVSATFTLAPGFNFATVLPGITASLNELMTDLSKQWASAISAADDNTGVVVRISAIESKVLGVNGIIDIENTKINGNASNLQLTEVKLPVLGTVTNV